MFTRSFSNAFLLILALASLPVLSACRKNKTLFLDIRVVDEETGEPLVCRAAVHYEKTGSQDVSGEVDLGMTDGEGRLKAKRDMGKKYGLQLYLYAGKYYTHAMSMSYHWVSHYGNSLYTGNKISTTVKVKPMYHYRVSIKNVNCFDETDTVWVAVNNQDYCPIYRYTGCADETPILGGFNDLSYTSIYKEVSFHVKVKRNGQVTEYDEAKQLNKGMVTPVSIHY